jgi:hypothetical protein
MICYKYKLTGIKRCSRSATDQHEPMLLELDEQNRAEKDSEH